MDKILTLFQTYIKDYPLDKIKNAIDLHNEFKQQFPWESLKTMPLERYALGKTQTGSLSWWLEYHSLPLGSIKGGSAVKHVIYYSTKGNDWKYPGQFSSVEEAWQQLRKDIIDLIEAYDHLPYRGIDQDNLLYTASMLKGKILYLYHPDKFLPIFKLEHLQKFLKEMGVPPREWIGKDSVECNLLLKQSIDQLALPLPSEDKEVQTVIIKDFLYGVFSHEENYYKIAPGEDAGYWGECRDGGYISVGWNEVGDINQYPDYDEFKNVFLKHNLHKTPNKNTEKANELWAFYNLKPGDRVLANKGMGQVVGIGTVTEKGYQYRDDLTTQKHVVYVQWDQVFDPPLIIPKQSRWPMKTLLEISRKNFTEWTTGGIKPVIRADSYSTEDEMLFARLEKALERKGQCILYGPPGTGKTYLARKYIKWKYEKEKLLAQAASSPVRLWMMVASNKFPFDWEAILDSGGTVGFNQGNVRKNFKIARKGDMVLCYRGGSGGKENGLVGLAEIYSEYNEQQDTITVKGIRSFKKVISYDEFKAMTEFKTTQAGRMGNRGTMFELNSPFIEWLINQLQEDGDKESADLLGRVAEGTEAVLCTFHPSFNYEDFIEGYKPLPTDNNQVAFALEKGIFVNLCEKAIQKLGKPYFLIIDEINRGNIPKIFGELITLLEKDKRGVELVLPQSKDAFSIPANVYIIGTMNTSDRSIKIMDAALKRRFAFIECMPNLSIIASDIDGLGISPANILDKINRSLVALGGRDKQIGHAYFMKNGSQISSVDELKEIYELDVIPLVQDYCFDDYDKLGEVVGKGFVDPENMTIRSDLFQSSNDIFISELINHIKRVNT